MMIIDATYSAEDNKLRLYASERLDADLYQRVKEMGFKWAPKQELFVAPMWTPDREDFCIELAGEITVEQTTLVERAEAKAERLDNLALKRAGESNSYHAAANRISERFAFGQPILVGHHSERKARKDQERMQNAMDKAVKAREAVSYWQYRAEGVERHANRKAAAGVRARRIKKLLAELRDRQRRINHAHLCLELWEKIESKKEADGFGELVKRYTDAHINTGAVAPYCKGESLWYLLDREKITPIEAVDKCLKHHEYMASNPYTFRWIEHILNRLAFERGELGPVVRFEGELTPVILQAFCRTHGADKPKANKSGRGFSVSSVVPLPLHIAEGKEVDLSADEWRDLMQASGYEVIAKERKAPRKQVCPLINPTPEQAQKLQDLWNAQALKQTYGKASERKEMTQSHYSAYSGGDYTPFNTIQIDETGARIWHSREGKTPVCRVRVSGGGELYAADRVITITDKPQKALPFDFDQLATVEA
jgi:hypothetical protein